MQFLKKHGLTIILGLFLIVLVVPQTSLPVKVFFQRLTMSSPEFLEDEAREKLSSSHWILNRMDGKAVNFSESANKIVLLNFWATWCPPCVAELPELQSLYDDYGEKMDFYFVTAEETADVKRFLEKREYDLPVYIQQYAAPKALQVETIPTTFLIDGEGVIYIQKTGAADWNSPEFRHKLDLLLQ